MVAHNLSDIHTPRAFLNRIPWEVFEDAKTGTISSVTKLFNSLTPRNYDLAALDVFLHNLDPALIRPCPPYPSKSSGMDSKTRSKMVDEFERFRMDGVKARYCSTEGLYLLLKQCPKHLLRSVMQDLLPHFDTVLDWYNFFLFDPIPQNPEEIRCGDPGRPCAILFLLMHEFPAVKQWLSSLDKALIYAIHAWTAVDPETGQVYTSFDMGNHECPQGQLLRTMLGSDIPDARQRIFDLLLQGYGTRGESTDLLLGVIDAAVCRCTSVAEVSRKVVEAQLASISDSLEISAPEAAFTYLNEVLFVVGKLNQDPTVSLEVIQSGFFKSFIEAVYDWILKKSKPGKDRAARQHGFTIMAGAEALLQMEGRRSAAHWKLMPEALESVIEGGFLEILMAGLSESKLGTHDAIVTAKSLELMKNACGKHPTLGRAMFEKLEELRGDRFWEGTFLGDTGYLMRWFEFSWDTIAANFCDASTPRLCDYLHCPGNRRTFTPSKTCSSCHSLMYCSTECQKADWVSLHRQECKAAQIDYEQALMHGYPHYTQYRRAFQVEYVARKMDTGVSCLRIDHGDNIEEKLAKTPCVIHLANWGFPLQALERYIRGCDATKNEDKHYLDRRLRDFARSYTNGEAKKGILLVQAEMSFYDQTVQILAKVKRDEEDEEMNKFMVLCCVTKLKPEEMPDRPPTEDEMLY
ncbi:hypothetical protein NMY22_g8436 [Coprinellus aureogranulatus]|nr:hypothetical protein NMY22_g8436 [Coprinellus aureogranulatus]